MFGRNEVTSPFPKADGSLLVTEVWRTIQGEGPDAGTPAIFVRLSKCNLRCHFSFGWFPTTGKQPFVPMVIGGKKKLGKIRIGDEILTLDNKGTLVETTVTNVVRQKVDQWYRIKIEGVWYYVTPEHPFFTTKGLLETKDLSVGDEILHTTRSDITSRWWRMNNPMYQQKSVNKKRRNTDWKAMGKKIAKTIAKKKREGTYEPSWNRLSKSQQAKVKSKISKTNSGSANGNYKESAANRNYYDLRNKVKKGYHCCNRCGHKPTRDEWPLEVHHKDRNRSNDKRSNLEVICKSCHTIEHEKWKNTPWYKKRQLEAHNGMRIEAIKFVDRSKWPPSVQKLRPALPIVSLTCGPYPTYLADYMWNHNCDTEFDKGEWYSVGDLLVKVFKLAGAKIRLVVLTGGEPLLQNINPFVSGCNANGIRVSVETAGTTVQPGLEYFFGPKAHIKNLIVCSPKTPKLNEELLPLIGAFKYIVSPTTVDLAGDGLPSASTQLKDKPDRIYRPGKDSTIPIYVQPLDEQDQTINEINARFAAGLAIEHGYRLSLQQHKIVGLP